MSCRQVTALSVSHPPLHFLIVGGMGHFSLGPCLNNRSFLNVWGIRWGVLSATTLDSRTGEEATWVKDEGRPGAQARRAPTGVRGNSTPNGGAPSMAWYPLWEGDPR